LRRQGHTDDVVDRVLPQVVDAVSWAYVGRQNQLTRVGPGRPPAASRNVLSIDIADILSREGLRGNWLAAGDDNEDGVLGPVAEIEAIAQTAYKQACGSCMGAAGRPARVTEARKLLGKVTRE
jgi:hypothetical protein